MIITTLIATGGAVLFFIKANGLNSKLADLEKNKNESTKTAQNSSGKSAQENGESNTDDSYLVINEWGVKLKVPASAGIKYDYSTYEGGEGIGLTNDKLLSIDSHCSCQFGSMSRRTAEATLEDARNGDNPGKLVHLTPINGYYYYYMGPMGACADDTAAVQEAMKGVDAKAIVGTLQKS